MELKFSCTLCGELHEELTDAQGCCFENTDCPADCTGIEHEPPSAPDRNGSPIWTCPNTDEEFRFCDTCGWEPEPRYGWNMTSPTLINGYWFCDPYEHDYSTCDSCGEWVYTDDARYDEYGEGSWCSGCFREEGAPAPSHPGRCDECGRGEPVKVNLLTEKCTCDGCVDPDAIRVDDD